MCAGALTAGSANPEVANLKVPCKGGVDGVIENVFKKCSDDMGAPFDPSPRIKCKEGGVLSDYS